MGKENLHPLQNHARTANSTPVLVMELKLVFMSDFASEMSNSRCKHGGQGTPERRHFSKSVTLLIESVRRKVSGGAVSSAVRIDLFEVELSGCAHTASNVGRTDQA